MSSAPSVLALDAGAQRESAAWVLGIGLGLALIAVCAAALLYVRARPIDPAAALAGSFELGELPFGMRFDAALVLPGGETVVVLRDEREIGFDPTRELAGTEAPAPATGDAKQPDWAALTELAPGGPPARLYLVRHRESAATGALDRSFRRLQWKDISELGAKGGRLALEGGRLAWGPFAADFVRERRYLPEPDFQDSLRVNLALPGRYWIAHAFWPRGYAGSKEPLEQLLAALRPVD